MSLGRKDVYRCQPICLVLCVVPVCVCGDGVMLQWPSNAIIRGGHIYGSSIGSSGVVCIVFPLWFVGVAHA